MIERTRGNYFKYLLNYLHKEVMSQFSTGSGPNESRDEDLETYYAYGYHAFRTGYYELSLKIFQFLTSYAPYTSYYWRALGAVNQQLLNYHDAIFNYDMAIDYDPEDVVSSVYRSECFILINEKEEALNSLSKLLKKFPKNEENSVWVDRAKLLISIHEKSDGSGSENA